MIKYLISLSFVLSAPVAFASGPSDQTVWKTASAVSSKRTESYACTRAKQKAKNRAEFVTEKDQAKADKEGINIQDRECETDESKKCSCSYSGDSSRCSFKARFKCTEWFYYHGQ